MRGRKITSSTPQQPVSELALWLLRELTLVGAARDPKRRGGGGIRWVLRLLREAWPKVAFQLLETASSVGQRDDPSSGYYSQSSDEDDHESAAAGSSLRLALLRTVAVLFAKEPSETPQSARNHGLPMLTVQVSGDTGHENPMPNRGDSSSAEESEPKFGESAHGVVVPVGHSGTDKVIQSMKIAFGNSGGLVQLVDIVCRKPRRQYANTVARDRHVAESRGAFFALGEVVRMCETNKRHIASHYGFITLSTKLKESLLQFDDSVFETLMEIAISRDDEVPLLARNEDTRGGVSVALSLSLLPRVVHILRPTKLWPIRDACSRPEFITMNSRPAWRGVSDGMGKEAASLSSGGNVTAGSDSSSRMGQGGTRGESSPGILQVRNFSATDSELTAALSAMSTGPPQEKHATTLTHVAMRAQGTASATIENMSHHDAMEALTRRFAEFEAAITKRGTVSPPPKKAPWDVSSTATPPKKYDLSYKFRSTEAAVMLIMLLPDSPVATQSHVLRALLQMVDSNPCNARSLCDMQVPTFLLRVSPQLPEQVLDLYMHLVARLLAYHVDHDVALLLFRLSQGNPRWLRSMIDAGLELEASTRTQASARAIYVDGEGEQRNAQVTAEQLRQASEPRIAEIEKKREDLKTLVTNILGSSIERNSPLSYFHFAKTGGALRTPPLEKFPAAKTGYSCSMWVNISSFSCSEPTLFSWGSANFEKILVQVFFMKPPRLDMDIGGKMSGGARGADSSAPYRYLCVRSWPSVQEMSAGPTTIPSGAQASSGGNDDKSDSYSAGSATFATSGTNERDYNQRKMMSSRVPVKCFNGFQWTTASNWHHIVMAHEKNNINVYIDGIAIESTWIVPVQLHHKANRIRRITHFPGCEGSAVTKSTISRDHPICGYFARRADEPLQILKEISQPPRRSQFSGMIGPIRVVEGIWDENHARRIYSQGHTFVGSLAESQIPGKVFMAIDASSYADIGKVRTSRSQSSLSTHFRSGRRSSTDFVGFDGTGEELVPTRGERSASGYGSILSESFLSASFENRDIIQWGGSMGGELASSISPARRRASTITEARSAPRRRPKTLGSLDEQQSMLTSGSSSSSSSSSSNNNGFERISAQISTSMSSKRLSAALMTRSPERRSLGGVSRNSSGALSDPRLGVSRARRSTTSDEIDEMSLNGGSLLRRQLVQHQQMQGLNLDLGVNTQQILDRNDSDHAQDYLSSLPPQSVFRRTKRNENLIEIEGAVEIHNTSSLKNAVQGMDGFMLSCKFLDIGESEQRSGLRIISLLLKQSPENLRHLTAMRSTQYSPAIPASSGNDLDANLGAKKSAVESKPPTGGSVPEYDTGTTGAPYDSMRPLVQLAAKGGEQVQTVYGFSVIHFLLTRHQHWWSADIFDYLFDMATDHSQTIERQVFLVASKGSPRRPMGSRRAARGNNSVLSQQKQTVDILLYCLLSLDIRKSLTFVRNILGAFVDFLGECPSNLSTFRRHLYSSNSQDNTKASQTEESQGVPHSEKQDVHPYDQITSQQLHHHHQQQQQQHHHQQQQHQQKGHLTGSGVKFLLDLMVEIIGSAMVADRKDALTKSTSEASAPSDNPADSSKNFESAAFDVTPGELSSSSSGVAGGLWSSWNRTKYQRKKNELRATFEARQAAFFPVIGVLRSVLLNCGTSGRTSDEQTFGASSLLPTTEQELRVVFDFLICASKELPYESSRAAVEPIKIQIADLLLNLVGNLQNNNTMKLLEAMRTVPDSVWDIPFSLVNSSIQKLNIIGLKLIKIFLATPAAQKQFRKMQGFAILQRMSGSWNASGPLLSALLSLATSESSASLPSEVATDTSNIRVRALAFPEVLEILLSTLKRCTFENRHVSAHILAHIEDLFAPEKVRSESGKRQAYDNIVALLDNKNSSVHWIYWFYETIRFREERFMGAGATRRWSVEPGEDEEGDEEDEEDGVVDSQTQQNNLPDNIRRQSSEGSGGSERGGNVRVVHTHAADEPTDERNAALDSRTEDDYFDEDSDVSSGTMSPALNAVLQAEEARYRVQGTRGRSYGRNTAMASMSPRSTAGSAPSVSGMSAMSLDSAMTSGTDSSAAFGVYTALYRIIRRLLLHDMCRSWRKNSSRLFNELMHMAALVDGVTISAEEAKPTVGAATARSAAAAGGGVAVPQAGFIESDAGVQASTLNYQHQSSNSENQTAAYSSTVEDSTGSVTVASAVTGAEGATDAATAAAADHVFHPISFVAYVLEDLIESIERSPQLPFAPSFDSFGPSAAGKTTATSNTLKNLMAMLDRIPQRIALSEAIMQKERTRDDCDAGDQSGFVERYANTPELISRAVGAVSAMATRNEGARSRMRDTGLLQLLEHLLMRCLSPFVLSSWEWEQRINSILSMDAVFERASGSKGFIAGSGILFLVQLFVDMTTISSVENPMQDDPQLWYWQVRLSTLMARVFRKSNTCRREIVKILEDPEIMDMMLPAVGMQDFDHRAMLVALGSWWSSSSSAAFASGGNSDSSAIKSSSGSGGVGASSGDDNASLTSSPSTSSLTSPPMSSETGASEMRKLRLLTRNADPNEYAGLLTWMAWINDTENSEKKNAMRKRIAVMLGPVYKSTESNTKKSIKVTNRVVQKHREGYQKILAKQGLKVADQESRLKLAVADATKRTAQWQTQARDTRIQSLSRGRQGWETIESLDRFYDVDFYRLVTEEHGPTDPWDAISEFVLGED
jgi:hypothetical protein